MNPKRFLHEAAAFAVIRLTIALAMSAPAGAEPTNPNVSISINSPTTGSVHKTPPSLLFSTQGIGMKQCSVDGREPESCISGWKPNSLTDGTHTYLATIETPDGSNSDSDSVSFKIDNTAPVVTMTGSPSGSFSNATNVNYSATVTDANPATLECEYPGVAWTVCGTTSGQIVFNGIAEGAYEFAFRATDAVGNQTEVSRIVTFDRTAPTVDISTGWGDKTNDNTPAFTLGFADQAPTTRSCRIVGRTEWKACGGSTWTVVDAIADGILSAEYRVEDLAGNLSTAAHAFEIDSTLPTIDVAPFTDGRTTDTTPTLEFRASDENGVTNKCAIDAVDWSQLVECNSGSFTASAPLALGNHTFWVESIDGFGNVSSTVYSFSIVEPPVDPNTGATPKPESGNDASPVKVAIAAKSGGIKKAKFVSTIKLSIKPSSAIVADTCRAKVRLAVRSGRRTIKRTVALKLVKGACVGVTKVKLPRALKGKNAAVTVSFSGNGKLAAFSHAGRLRRL